LYINSNAEGVRNIQLKMRVTLAVALSTVGALASGELEKRLNNGLGKTPAMGE
jgi:hypothetical protein